MSNFLEYIKDAFNSGDPEASKWFLVRQTYLPFTLCGMYILFSTIIGPAIMKNKKPFQLRGLMVVFDFLLVGAYMACLLVCLWCSQYLRLVQFCKEERVKLGDVSYTIVRTFWIIYILKYIELFDTVFFVLRKKRNQITFLHVAHHASIPIIVWVIFRTDRSGFQGIVGMLNSVTHILMYSYYGLAALGRQYTKYLWWKKYVTIIQMIQLFLIILLVTVVAPLFGCGTSVFSYILEMCIVPLFLYLFYKLFKSQHKTVRVPLDKFVIIHDVPYEN